MNTLIKLIVTTITLLLSAVPLQATELEIPEPEILPAGFLYTPATEETSRTTIPLQNTYVVIDITPGLAQTTIVQEFTNTSDRVIEAIYLFPIPTDATISDMELHYDDRIIASKVQRKDEAKATYEKANSEGKKAALVEHHRTNLFSTAVANFQPGETVEIHLTYVEDIEYERGKYTLRHPMVASNNSYFGTTTKTFAPEANESTETPNYAKAHRITFDILLSGIPIESISSSTHTLKTENDGSVWTVSLSDPTAIPDRDFELDIGIDINDSTQPSILTTKTATGLYGLLTLFPPEKTPLPTRSVAARDIIFLVDHSGSMGVERMNNTRKGINSCLNKLNWDDRFKLVIFDDTFETYSETFRPATKPEIHAAKNYMSKVQSAGGTEMQPALQACLKMFGPNTDRSKTIVFLTDGDVGNEAQLVSMLENDIADVRLFTIGIGTAPNEFLIKKMAKAGRGQSRFIHNDKDIAKEIASLFLTLDSPVLTDIKLKFIDQNDQELDLIHFPDPIADLFVNTPVQVSFRSEKRVPSKLVLSAKKGHAVIQETYFLNNDKTPHPGLEFLFGSKLIERLQTDFNQATTEEQKAQIEEEMTNMALLFQLVTPFTSRVAVEESTTTDTTKSPNTTLGNFAGTSSNDEDIFELSPFCVDASSDTGYTGISTLSGTRLRTSLSSGVASTSIQIITREFLEDIAATDVSQLNDYASGVYNNLAVDNFSETGFSANFNSDTTLTDLHSIERVVQPTTPTPTIYSGSNPLSSKSISTIAANMKQSTKLGLAYGNDDYSDIWVDHNQPLGRSENHAVRLVAAKQKQEQTHESLRLVSRSNIRRSTIVKLDLSHQEIETFGSFERYSLGLEQQINDRSVLSYSFTQQDDDLTDDNRFLIGDTENARYNFPAANQLNHTANYDKRSASSHTLDGSFGYGDYGIRHNLYVFVSQNNVDETITEVQSPTKAIENNHKIGNIGFTYLIDAFNDTLSLSLGQKNTSTKRTDKHSNRAQNIGAAWKISNALSLTSNYSEADKTPTIYQQIFRNDSGIEFPNTYPTLKDEFSHGYDIGLAFKLFGSHYTGSISYFESTHFDRVYRDWETEAELNKHYANSELGLISPIIFTNFEKMKQEGVSFNLIGTPSRNLSFIFNAYIDWADNTPVLGAKNKVSLFARYDFSEGLLRGMFIGGGFRYREESLFNDGYVIPDTFLTDFLIGYQVRTFDGFKPEVQLNLRNIGEKPYQQSRFQTPKGQEVILSLKLKF